MDEEDRIQDDPKYKAAALLITADAGEEGAPMAWRIQEDGTLTVILPSGKKINRPLPAVTPAAAAGVTAEKARPTSPTPEVTSLKQQPARSRTVKKRGK